MDRREALRAGGLAAVLGGFFGAGRKPVEAEEEEVAVEPEPDELAPEVPLAEQRSPFDLPNLLRGDRRLRVTLSDGTGTWDLKADAVAVSMNLGMKDTHYAFGLGGPREFVPAQLDAELRLTNLRSVTR